MRIILHFIKYNTIQKPIKTNTFYKDFNLNFVNFISFNYFYPRDNPAQVLAVLKSLEGHQILQDLSTNIFPKLTS